MNQKRQLLLLFSQLSWPSGMVRERACAAIAELLCEPRLADLTRGYLLKWVAEQRLESVAAIGLLPLILVQAQSDGSTTPKDQDLDPILSSPSLLSWLLLRELKPLEEVPLAAALAYSGTVPREFSLPEFFSKYVESFLPPIYEFWAKTVEKREGLAFRRQWAYEWHLKVQQLGIGLSTKSLDFWVRQREGTAYYAGADTQLSEVYRSAYLRALAWAVATTRLAPAHALFLASQACPIDLELWCLKPASVPEWWPQIDEPKAEVDMTIGQIWHQVETLWKAQGTGTCSWGTGWLLGQASGVVYQGSTIYDLEICGILQKCHGPEVPYMGDLVEWYRGESGRDGNRLDLKYASHLRFRGTVPRPLDPLGVDVRRFGHWTVVPISGYANIAGTIPRWQYWRMFRKIWLPNPHLSDESLMVEGQEDALQIHNEAGVIGKWSDWTDGLGEKLVDSVPPNTGQYLLVSRSVLEEFAAQTSSSICWICRLKRFYREHSYEPYNSFTDYRVYGASGIITV